MNVKNSEIKVRFGTVYVRRKAEALMVRCAKFFRRADGQKILSFVNENTRTESVLRFSNVLHGGGGVVGTHLTPLFAGTA